MRSLLFLFAFIYTQQVIAQKALECELSLLDISIETDGDSVSIKDYNDYTITITYQNTGYKSCELYPGNTASFTGQKDNYFSTYFDIFEITNGDTLAYKCPMIDYSGPHFIEDPVTGEIEIHYTLAHNGTQSKTYRLIHDCCSGGMPKGTFLYKGYYRPHYDMDGMKPRDKVIPIGNVVVTIY